MSGIQYQALSDAEFERAVYMAIGTAGALPAEIATELAKRNAQGGRDQEHRNNALNPQQLNLPFNV